MGLSRQGAAFPKKVLDVLFTGSSSRRPIELGMHPEIKQLRAALAWRTERYEPADVLLLGHAPIL